LQHGNTLLEAGIDFRTAIIGDGIALMRQRYLEFLPLVGVLGQACITRQATTRSMARHASRRSAVPNWQSSILQQLFRMRW
jgi:hypothetical protein